MAFNYEKGASVRKLSFLAVAGVRVFVGVFLNVGSQIEKLIELLSGKIKRCKTVSHEDSFLLSHCFKTDLPGYEKLLHSLVPDPVGIFVQCKTL